MSRGPMRRVAWVLAAYALGAGAVLLGAQWLQRVLALPPLFRALGAWMLVGGVPLAILIAWRYPALGAGAGEPGPHRDDPPGRGR